MRVGVYVDGFNVYYRARSMFGKGSRGWKWLDLRSVTTNLVAARPLWAPATIDRVVYCTARVDTGSNRSAAVDQDIYIRALLASGSVDHVEFGYYVTRLKNGGLARRTRGASFELVDLAGRPLRLALHRTSSESHNARKKAPTSTSPRTCSTTP